MSVEKNFSVVVAAMAIAITAMLLVRRIAPEGSYFEDGDRAEALGAMGKVELVIDLNPLSRSAQVAAVPIIDNVIRAVPNIARHARKLRNSNADLDTLITNFDPETALADAERVIRTSTDGSSRSLS